MLIMRKIRLSKNNYYTPEADEAYWSATFVKNMSKCPAAAIATARHEWGQEKTTALMVGQYIDAWFDGKKAYRSFVDNNPDIFNSRTGELKADYRKAREMIERAQNDPVFMEFMRGRKQTIRTGTIGGIPFRCKMDVYRKNERIVDLKTVKDMQPMYLPEVGKVSFAEYWNWPLQLAIYQALEGNNLPCYLAVITKEEPPDIAIIEVPQHVLDAEMEMLKEKLPMFDAMRNGIIEPERCENCSYCRKTRKLTGAISLDELTEL